MILTNHIYCVARSTAVWLLDLKIREILLGYLWVFNGTAFTHFNISIPAATFEVRDQQTFDTYIDGKVYCNIIIPPHATRLVTGIGLSVCRHNVVLTIPSKVLHHSWSYAPLFRNIGHTTSKILH